MINYDQIQPYFDMVLDKNEIPAYQKFYYRKWLKYYLHFCFKYNFDELKMESLFAWLKKLEQKKQTEFQTKQAKHSINLFYSLNPSTPQQLPKVPSVPVEDKLFKDRQNLNEESDSSSLTSWHNVFVSLEAEIKLRHYSKKTLEIYTMWVNQAKRYCKKPPGEFTSRDVRNFLEYLAVKRNVAGSTQNQAFNALLFLFRHVLKKDFSGPEDTPRAKRVKYIPTVLSRKEVQAVFDNLLSPYKLLAQLMYGCGLRSKEGTTLRVKDIGLDNNMLTIRQGKGKKDRTVPLPVSLESSLKAHIKRVKSLYDQDVRAGFAGTFVLDGEDKKIKNCLKDFAGYWLFPAKGLVFIPDENRFRRYFSFPTNFQKALKEAVNRAGICKRVTPHTLRHSFATHLLEEGYNIKQVQELLGHNNVQTTMVYLHTVKTEIKQPRSPLDFLYSNNNSL